MNEGKDVSKLPVQVMPRRVVPREKVTVAPVAQRKLHVVQDGPVSAEPAVGVPVPCTNRKAIHAFPELPPAVPEPEEQSGGAPLAAYLLTAAICGTVGGIIGLFLLGTMWGVVLSYFAAGSAGFLALALFLLCRPQDKAPGSGRNRIP